jgi:hypothetical protein
MTSPDQENGFVSLAVRAAALAGRAVEIGKADRGFQNPGSEQEPNQRPACGFQRTASVISSIANSNAADAS